MFIDRIMRAERFQSTTELINDPVHFINELKGSVAVLVDNVSEYYYLTSTQEYWDLEADFPNIAPPWPSIWFEWSPTEYVNSAVMGLQKANNYGIIKKFGVLMKTDEIHTDYSGISDDEAESRIVNSMISESIKDYYGEIRKEDIDRMMANYLHWLRGNKEYRTIIKAYKEHLQKKAIKVSNEIRWVAEVTAFLRVHKEIFLLPIKISLLIGRDGKFKSMHQRDGGAFYSHPLVKEISRAEIDEYADMFGLLLHVPLLSLCFANCKNVFFKRYSASGDKKRAYNIKKKRQFVKYHVLSINPVKKVLNSEGKAMETGLRRAMHLCRGHFATYSETSPLFGKHVGTFWRPMHIRGQADEGIVIKDYAVRANQEVSHGLV